MFSKDLQRVISHFMKWSCQTAGKPATFITALVIVIVWLIIGLFWGISDTWLLIINTLATINASLMVFVIQHTQNRESRALQIKIDHLLLVIKEAEKALISIEEAEEEELDEIRRQLLQKRKNAQGE